MSLQVYQPRLTIWVSQKIFPTSRGDGGFPKVKLFTQFLSSNKQFTKMKVFWKKPNIESSMDFIL